MRRRRDHGRIAVRRSCVFHAFGALLVARAGRGSIVPCDTGQCSADQGCFTGQFVPGVRGCLERPVCFWRRACVFSELHGPRWPFLLAVGAVLDPAQGLPWPAGGQGTRARAPGSPGAASGDPGKPNGGAGEAPGRGCLQTSSARPMAHRGSGPFDFRHPRNPRLRDALT